MMKKLMFAAVAASMVATPVLAAAPGHNDHRSQPTRTVVVKKPAPKTVYKPAPKVVYKKVTYKAKWNRGERFDARYARNYRQIDYRQHRGLKAPPRGYRYVQSGNDAVLVGVTTGIVLAVFANMLR